MKSSTPIWSPSTPSLASSPSSTPHFHHHRHHAPHSSPRPSLKRQYSNDGIVIVDPNTITYSSDEEEAASSNSTSVLVNGRIGSHPGVPQNLLTGPSSPFDGVGLAATGASYPSFAPSQPLDNTFSSQMYNVLTCLPCRICLPYLCFSLWRAICFVFTLLCSCFLSLCCCCCQCRPVTKDEDYILYTSVDPTPQESNSNVHYPSTSLPSSVPYTNGLSLSTTHKPIYTSYGAFQDITIDKEVDRDGQGVKQINGHLGSLNAPIDDEDKGIDHSKATVWSRFKRCVYFLCSCCPCVSIRSHYSIPISKPSTSTSTSSYPTNDNNANTYPRPYQSYIPEDPSIVNPTNNGYSTPYISSSTSNIHPLLPQGDAPLMPTPPPSSSSPSSSTTSPSSTLLMITRRLCIPCVYSPTPLAEHRVRLCTTLIISLNTILLILLLSLASFTISPISPSSFPSHSTSSFLTNLVTSFPIGNIIMFLSPTSSSSSSSSSPSSSASSPISTPISPSLTPVADSTESITTFASSYPYITLSLTILFHILAFIALSRMFICRYKQFFTYKSITILCLMALATLLLVHVPLASTISSSIPTSPDDPSSTIDDSSSSTSTPISFAHSLSLFITAILRLLTIIFLPLLLHLIAYSLPCAMTSEQAMLDEDDTPLILSTDAPTESLPLLSSQSSFFNPGILTPSLFTSGMFSPPRSSVESPYPDHEEHHQRNSLLGVHGHSHVYKSPNLVGYG